MVWPKYVAQTIPLDASIWGLRVNYVDKRHISASAT
jgi:hypothetical protein